MVPEFQERLFLRRLVHRLDRNTSGAMIVARTADAAAWLSAALRRPAEALHGGDGSAKRGSDAAGGHPCIICFAWHRVPHNAHLQPRNKDACGALSCCSACHRNRINESLVAFLCAQGRVSRSSTTPWWRTAPACSRPAPSGTSCTR